MDDIIDQGVTELEAAAPDSEPSAEPQIDQQEKNWREMRRSMERLQQRNLELEAEARVRREMEAKYGPKEEEYALPSEDWVTGKDVEKYTSKMIQKQIESGVARALQQHEDSRFEDRLRSAFHDYDQVVSPEAIEDLKYSDPEFVSLIQSSSASKFDKGAAVYKYLQKKRPSEVAKQNAKKLEANQAKPTSVHQATRQDVAGDSTLGGRMTKEMKNRLYKEMCEAASRRA